MIKWWLFYWSLYKYFIVQILVNIQIFPLVGGNSSSTRPVKLYSKVNLYEKDLLFCIISLFPSDLHIIIDFDL